MAKVTFDRSAGINLLEDGPDRGYNPDLIPTNGHGQLPEGMDKLSKKETQVICEAVETNFDVNYTYTKVTVKDFIKDYLHKSTANPHLGQRALSPMTTKKKFNTTIAKGGIEEMRVLIVYIQDVIDVIDDQIDELSCPERVEYFDWLRRNLQVELEEGKNIHIIDGNTRKDVLLQYWDINSTTKFNCDDSVVWSYPTFDPAGNYEMTEIVLNRYSMSKMKYYPQTKLQNLEVNVCTAHNIKTLEKVSEIFEEVNSSTPIPKIVGAITSSSNGFKNQMSKTALSYPDNPVRDRLPEVYSGSQLTKVRKLNEAISRGGGTAAKIKHHGILIVHSNVSVRMLKAYRTDNSEGCALLMTAPLKDLADVYLSNKNFKLTKTENKIWQDFLAGVAEVHNSPKRMDMPDFLVYSALIEIMIHADSPENKSNVKFDINNYAGVFSELRDWHDTEYAESQYMRYTKGDVELSQNAHKTDSTTIPLTDNDIGKEIKDSTGNSIERKDDGYWGDSKYYHKTSRLTKRNIHIAENFLYADNAKRLVKWINDGWVTAVTKKDIPLQGLKDDFDLATAIGEEF